MEARFPAGPRMDMRKALLFLGRRDFATAEDSLRVLTARHKADASWHDRFLNSFAGVLAIRGKLAEANRVLATLAELRRAQSEGRWLRRLAGFPHAVFGKTSGRRRRSSMASSKPIRRSEWPNERPRSF